MGFFDKIKKNFSHNDSKGNDEHYDLNEKYEKIFNDIENDDFENYDINIRMFEKIHDKCFFDEEYYVKNYVPFLSKKYSLLHYLNEGFKYGYNPNDNFNNNKYLNAHPNIKKMGLNPLVHYLLCSEGKVNDEKFLNLNKKYERVMVDVDNNNINIYDKSLKYYDRIKDTELFDANFYITHYELPLSEEYALLHFLNEGFKLGYNPSEDFNCDIYLKNNSDVFNSGINPFVHYVLYGKKESRKFPWANYKEIQNQISYLQNEVQINRILQNISILRDKVSKGKKINIVFILPAMAFAYAKLYEFFDKDDNFNVHIVLVPHRIGNNEVISDVAKDKYYQIYSMLKERNYNVIEGFNFETNEGIDLEYVCSPNIIFYVLPYMRIYPHSLKIKNLSNDILFAYIPYGEFIGDLDDNNFNFGWNEKIWKIFSGSAYAKNAIFKSDTGLSNIVIAGSPRMDSLINFEPSKFDYNWIFDSSENKKRIIWAPHHTLPRPNMDDELVFSTFDKNYKFFYEYAKNNPDIEWVLRPHPLLKEILAEVNTYMKIEGIATNDFVDDYFFKWESLPNARVHEELDYIDLFATADAMITDCVSFKGEFLFANKPGLILTTDSSLKSNKFKEDVYGAWYVANGSDFNEIEQFIENVVIGGNDYLKEKREEIFLDNFNINLGKASEFIYNYIKEQLF